MMTLRRADFHADDLDLSSGITESLCAFEALRILGFPPDDIYFLATPLDDGKIGLRVLLSSQGKEFIIDVAVVTGSGPAVIDRWQQRAAEYNASAKTDLRGAWMRDVFRQSNLFSKAPELVVRLKLRGFRLATDELAEGVK
jgi:hypothetical protein